MGRKPTRWLHLPPGMRARPRGTKVFYYFDTGAKPRRELPLGSDYNAALVKWAELAAKEVPVQARPISLADVINGVGDCRGYRKDVLPEKSSRTQSGNENEIEFLLRYFDNPPAPLEGIEPQHVRKYMRWRLGEAQRLEREKNELRRKQGRPEKDIPANFGHVRANREKALLSHIWNYARGEGLTALPNPCAGIKGFTEEGRDTAPDDDLVQRVIAVADAPTAFALRLAERTGQRPGDVLRMSEQHIDGPVPGGILNVRQGKTQAKLRIVIEGELADLLTEMLAYKRAREQEQAKSDGGKVRVMALLVKEDGKPLTRDALRSRFDDARAAAGVEKELFQFRDLRAKAATEADDAAGTRTAQAILGHTTEGMTADYIRHKVGRKVRLVK